MNQSQQSARANSLSCFPTSLRNNSLNAQLAAQLIEKNSRTIDLANMNDFNLPSFNQDLEANNSHPNGAEEFLWSQLYR